MADDVAAFDSQAARDQLDVGFIQRAAFDQRWRGKGNAVTIAAQLHQADATFLNNEFSFGFTTRLEPGVAAAQCGVTGKWQLPAWTEDAHFVVGLWVFRWQQKRGLREVGPVGEMLHFGSGEAAAIQHHGQWVAEVRRGGENINLFEGALAHRTSFGQYIKTKQYPARRGLQAARKCPRTSAPSAGRRCAAAPGALAAGPTSGASRKRRESLPSSCVHPP